MKFIRAAALCLVFIFLFGTLLSCVDNSPKEPLDTDKNTPADIDTEPSAGTTTSSPNVETSSATGDNKQTAEELFYMDNFAAGAIGESVSPAVMAFLSCNEYYADSLQKGIAAGQKWVYSNSSTYVPQRGYYDDMVKSGKYGANCASPVNWAFIDMGIMPSSMRFYGGSTGNFANYTSVLAFLEPVCEIYDLTSEGKDFKQLYKEGRIKAGDIFLATHHTFIYRGDQTFYAAGHDGAWHTDPTAATEDSRKAVFDNWIMDMTTCTNYNYKVYYQIRLKDEFVPQYYRDSDGKLAENPMYDPETSMAYNPKDNFSYETNGRDNVLGGAAFSKSNGFNLKKLSDFANLTDGQVYYDNTTLTYSDFQMEGGAAYGKEPTYWFDANGNRSNTKDQTYKYLCGFKTTLDKVYKLDAFAVYSQNVGATSGVPIGDIDGFDILVSLDGTNWTVAYSIENATGESKWTDVTDQRNINVQNHNMTHYIYADFTTGPIEAKHVLFALSAGRTQNAEGAAKYGYNVSASTDYFRLSELQVYSVDAPVQ